MAPGPRRGKQAKRRQRRKQRACFEETARLAALSGAGNRNAATVERAPARVPGDALNSAVFPAKAVAFAPISVRGCSEGCGFPAIAGGSRVPRGGCAFPGAGGAMKIAGFANHRRGKTIPAPVGAANRAASSKQARCFRRWRRFACFPHFLWVLPKDYARRRASEANRPSGRLLGRRETGRARWKKKALGVPFGSAKG